ncbi:hypothetical protein B0H17DRAFT_1125631 [Mycena rosella]|uniref:Uncharacterized protein n=1 Tax=Mycena rosella TaxID=1033263 RepID=A0AAD7M9H3_MYCRO|nr:hypothetical protein B0H17DRAFT_1125631 [Mycena rosella]
MASEKQYSLTGAAIGATYSARRALPAITRTCPRHRRRSPLAHHFCHVRSIKLGIPVACRPSCRWRRLMPHHQAGVQADVAVLSSQQLPKRPTRMSPPLRQSSISHRVIYPAISPSALGAEAP